MASVLFNRLYKLQSVPLPNIHDQYNRNTPDPFSIPTPKFSRVLYALILIATYSANPVKVFAKVLKTPDPGHLVRQLT